jgi:putative FmdB family regulatory protein
MPMYSYTCTQCGHTADQLRKLEDRDEPIECSVCESTMIRVVAKTSPPKFIGDGFTEKFYE